MWWDRKRANQYADLGNSSGRKQQKLVEKQGADYFVCFVHAPCPPPTNADYHKWYQGVLLSSNFHFGLANGRYYPETREWQQEWGQCFFPLFLLCLDDSCSSSKDHSLSQLAPTTGLSSLVSSNCFFPLSLQPTLSTASGCFQPWGLKVFLVGFLKAYHNFKYIFTK